MSIKDLLEKERTKPLWRHGAELKHRFNTFEVDTKLVEKHMPKIRDQDMRISEALQASPALATLYKHPKLLRSYYWKDYATLNQNQRVSEIKRALALPNEPNKKAKDSHWSDGLFARKQRLLAPIRASFGGPAAEYGENPLEQVPQNEQPRTNSTPAAALLKTPGSHPYESGLLSQPSQPGSYPSNQASSAHLKSKKSSKASLLRPAGEAVMATVKLRKKKTEVTGKVNGFTVDKATEEFIRNSSRLVRSISGSLLSKVQAKQSAEMQRESRNQSSAYATVDNCEELPRMSGGDYK